MPSVVIGNDIISLSSLPNYDENRCHRYARKIMVDSEYDAWQQSGASEINLFKYWALKEAAYKIWNRETRERVFNPKWFEVENLGAAEKVAVRGPKENYSGMVTVHEHYIYAVLLDSKQDEIRSQSSIYETGITDRSSRKILKKGELPFVNIKNELFPVSLSHCGNWCAQAIPAFKGLQPDRPNL